VALTTVAMMVAYLCQRRHEYPPFIITTVFTFSLSPDNLPAWMCFLKMAVGLLRNYIIESIETNWIFGTDLSHSLTKETTINLRTGICAAKCVVGDKNAGH